MMGSRGYKGGDECDAFSRQSRRIVPRSRSDLTRIKRQFWKRVRKAGAAEAKKAEHAD